MSRLMLRRPSAAITISILALTVAVAGGGEAIADETVRIAKKINGSRIKNGSITGKQIKNTTIRNQDLGDNTLTGEKINESELGNVPSATNAFRAVHALDANTVDGTFVKTFNFRGPPSSGRTNVFEHAGYRVEAECDGAMDPIVTITNVSAGPSELIVWRSGVADTPVASNSAAFIQNSSVAVLDPAKPRGAVSVSAAGSGGAVLTGQLSHGDSPGFASSFTGCYVAGTFSSN
ncbi:MAG: hypothetical protein ACRDKE_11070 [Solirubrobacterales bacterium]